MKPKPTKEKLLGRLKRERMELDVYEGEYKKVRVDTYKILLNNTIKILEQQQDRI